MGTERELKTLKILSRFGNHQGGWLGPLGSASYRLVTAMGGVWESYHWTLTTPEGQKIRSGEINFPYHPHDWESESKYFPSVKTPEERMWASASDKAQFAYFMKQTGVDDTIVQQWKDDMEFLIQVESEHLRGNKSNINNLLSRVETACRSVMWLENVYKNADDILSREW